MTRHSIHVPAPAPVDLVGVAIPMLLEAVGVSLFLSALFVCAALLRGVA
jgi:hypothetical protein